MSLDLETIKQYIRVDYDDDDGLIQLITETVFEEMEELIDGFDREKPTNRQKLLILTSIKDLYDNREKYMEKTKLLKSAVSSMMLKEIYK